MDAGQAVARAEIGDDGDDVRAVLGDRRVAEQAFDLVLVLGGPGRERGAVRGIANGRRVVETGAQLLRDRQPLGMCHGDVTGVIWHRVRVRDEAGVHPGVHLEIASRPAQRLREQVLGVSREVRRPRLERRRVDRVSARPGLDEHRVELHRAGLVDHAADRRGVADRGPDDPARAQLRGPQGLRGCRPRGAARRTGARAGRNERRDEEDEGAAHWDCV